MDPDPSSPERTDSLFDAGPVEPLPALSREALERIEQAEKEAKARYEEARDRYFPTNADFVFEEGFVRRAMEWIIAYLRVYAEDILDANLREFLAVAPSDLLTNRTLLKSIWQKILDLAEPRWMGYKTTVWLEPTSRRSRYMMALASGTTAQHPELVAPYPDGEVWAEICRKMKPDLERLNKTFYATLGNAVSDGIKRYQAAAASTFGIPLEGLKWIPLFRAEEAPSGPKEPATSAKETPPAPQAAPIPKRPTKPKRRNEQYKQIDEMLRLIADSRPRSHEEVFQALDGRKVRIPPAKPFKSVRCWMDGFRKDKPASRAWLSKRWTELDLPSFARGPK